MHRPSTDSLKSQASLSWATIPKSNFPHRSRLHQGNPSRCVLAKTLAHSLTLALLITAPSPLITPVFNYLGFNHSLLLKTLVPVLESGVSASADQLQSDPLREESQERGVSVSEDLPRQSAPPREQAAPSLPSIPGEEVTLPSGKTMRVWSTRGPVEVSPAPQPFPQQLPPLGEGGAIIIDQPLRDRPLFRDQPARERPVRGGAQDGRSQAR